MSVETGHRSEQVLGPGDSDPTPASYGAVLALTATAAIAACLLLICAVLLVAHPPGSGYLATVVIGQNQRAKTALYLASFAVILPLALVLMPRLADRIAAGPSRAALPGLSALTVIALSAALIAARLLDLLSLAHGLGVVLGCVAAASAGAAVVLARAAQPRPWPPLERVRAYAPMLCTLAGAFALGAVLCITALKSLSALGLVFAALAAAGVVLAYGRLSVPKLGRFPGCAVDAVAVVLLLLAIPDVVVFTSSGTLPNVYFEPGVIQFQQDWILGPANQVLHGGALLVNDPSSQYGVGLVYFLGGWFHLAPIGYGTFGLLDGLLTALLYVGGYAILRIAGVTRVLAAAALAFGVVVFIYALHFNVGALPEQGPLRFGLPILVVLALTAAARWPARERGARVAALAVVAVSSIWAIEAFAYTTFTFIAISAVEARLRTTTPGRGWWFVRQLVIALAGCVCAHVLFAFATLVGSGHLPDWGQYLAYVHGLLLGGREGSITFGFARWSPALALGALCLVSAAAVALLVLRTPAFARRERAAVIALAGSTAYAIASFSYTDNRSSTYLLLYVAPPALIASALWLSLVLRPVTGLPQRPRTGALAFVAAVAALMIAAAWPALGAHFNRSALAHAYPGGGLRAALHRLWHPPAIDPRAPDGVRLVEAYLPGTHVLVLLPTSPDLAIEIMMRAHRASALFIGDPSGDSFIPQVWMPRIQRQIDRLRPGTRILTSEDALRIVAALRAHTAADAFAHQVAGGATQLQWALHQIDRRFELRPIARGPHGFVVVGLAVRPR